MKNSDKLFDLGFALVGFSFAIIIAVLAAKICYSIITVVIMRM